MFKRITTLLICFFIIFTFTFSVPVFADVQSNVPDGYSPCGLNDQVDAFKSYCQSRNLVIEGSGLDVVTAFTTNAYQGAIRKAGLDINELQNQIYKNTNNVGAKWFFTQTGISAYNRIFAEFLQNNDLEVGDTADAINNTVYSGELITDINGVSCLVTVINSQNFVDVGTNKYYVSSNSDEFLYYGSKYLLDGFEAYTYKQNYPSINPITYQSGFYSNSSTTTLADISISSSSSKPTLNNYYYIFVVSRASSQSRIYGGDYNLESITYNGYVSIIHNVYNNRYYLGSISNNSYVASDTRIYPVTIDSADIYLTTNNNTINNNTYEGDTYITNEGDVNPPAEIPPGGNDPGWNVGGGQGSYDDGQGNNYTINFPDFELPDLNIDWSIQGLGNKFPFSIPFDIAALVTVLNAEPEAPRFQGTVNFGFTSWDYDINLEQFDSVAQACRIAELLLLVFGLILITRSIIKG